MAIGLSGAALFNVATALLLAALGIFVASRRPRTRASLAFGVFLVTFGLWVAAWYLFTLDDPRASGAILGRMAVAVVGAGALAVLAVSYPRPLAKAERRLLVLPALLAAGFYAVAAFLTTRTSPDLASFFRGAEAGVLETILFQSWGTQLLHALAVGVIVLFPLRFAATPPHDHGARRQYALLGAGLMMYWGFTAGAGQVPGTSILSGLATWVALDVAMLVPFGVACIAWLRCAVVHPDAHLSRNMAILSVALPFVGLVFAAFVDRPGVYAPTYGAVRLVSILVFAYAILRAQLFDIDLKLKWTLSKGTVAAAFVAVFFMVSEGAERLLSDRIGPVAGLLAAGALVFALVPLQRAADRMADKAMPHVRDDPQYRLVKKREARAARVGVA